MRRREQGDLYDAYEVDARPGFQLSPEGKRIMIMAIVTLALAFLYLFIKVKIDPDFFNNESSDF